jgi:ABC-type oligopeptide transport system ATPase subunit
MINIKNIKKIFPSKSLVKKGFSNITFDLKKGQATALCGESGCGKTTIALCLTGLMKLDDGSIYINNQNLNDLNPKNRKTVLLSTFQIVFQNTLNSLHPQKSIRKLFYDTLFYLHKFNPQKIPNPRNTSKIIIQNEFENIMDKVGLHPKDLDKLPLEFSGGEIQRICIARALIAKPDFLIADEPVSCLDVTTQAKILNLIKNIIRQTNMGLLFITHDLAAAQFVCDNAIIMKNGSILDYGESRDIFDVNGNINDYTKQLLQALMLED